MSHPVPNSLRSLLGNRAHRLATLWRIERTDGVVMGFTDHNSPLTYGGKTYTPVSSVNASARQAIDGLRDQNLEVLGVVSGPTIRESDLRGGRYREAKVIEYVVDWGHPWAGPIVENHYWLVETNWTGEVWRGQLSGRTRWLDQPVGDVYGQTCRHTLGSDECGVTIGSYQVTAVIEEILVQRKKIRCPDLAAFPAGRFNNGRIAFVAGALNNHVGEIKKHEAGGILTLQLATPFDMYNLQITQVRPGCPKTVQGCKGVDGDAGRPWPNNIINFGGFPFIPGDHKVLQAPRAK